MVLRTMEKMYQNVAKVKVEIIFFVVDNLKIGLDGSICKWILVECCNLGRLVF